MVSAFLILEEIVELLSRVTVPFYIPTSGTGVSLFLCILANILFFPLKKKTDMYLNFFFFNLQIPPPSLSFSKNVC